MKRGRWAVLGLVPLVVGLLWLALRAPGPVGSVELPSAPDAALTATEITTNPSSGGTTKPAPAGEANDAGPSLETPPNAQVVARFGWGSGADQLGREGAQEGNPEGPMSFTVAPDGTIVVLDQVNQRLVKLDAKGNRLGTTPLPLQAAQDVVVTKDGTSLVIDRLVDKAVAVIGPDGKQRGELPIEGKGLTEGGASTGIFDDGDDVLVEREHGDLVRIGKTSGKADPERAEVPGRPSKDGASYLTALLADAASGTITLTAIAKATLEHRFTRQVSFGQPILSLVMLDSDPSGLAYVGANVESAGSTAEQPRFTVAVLCLDGRDGAVLGRAAFPATVMADETFRELSVAGDGTILFLRRSEAGAQLERHRCQ